MFKSTISAAESQLNSYLSFTGNYYEKKRNYTEDFENNKITTSLLSPYIRYRVISEKTVLEKVLEKHGPNKAEK